MDISDAFKTPKPQGEIINPHVYEAVEAPQQKPGKVELIPPKLPAADTYTSHPLQDFWWIVVYPATDLHHRLAAKLAGQKSGQLVPLTPDEMALLTEFMVWPKPPRTASF